MMRRALSRAARRLAVRAGLLRRAAITVNGRTLVIPDAHRSHVGRALAGGGAAAFEPELVRLVAGWDRSIGTFLDGGANIGIFAAIAALRTPPPSRVIAVEPLPTNLAALARIIAANHLAVEVVAAAIAPEASDSVTLHVPHGVDGAETIPTLVQRFEQGAVFAGMRTSTLSVRATTLEALLDRAPGPLLLKLDIEGMEADVLAASPTLLARDDLDLVVEITINDPTRQRLFDLLTAAGYRAWLLTLSGLVAEDRPLTIPPADRGDRTLWRNHLFSRRPAEELRALSRALYGHVV